MKSSPKPPRRPPPRRQDRPRHRRAGFIGSNFIRFLLGKYPDIRIVTWTTDLRREPRQSERRRLRRPPRVHSGATSGTGISSAAIMDHVQGVFHFAAETHVDRSILDAGEFVLTDVHGTYVLLEAVRRTPPSSSSSTSPRTKSTAAATRGSSRNPPPQSSSPYSASKAGADRLAYAYHVTYGAPVMIVRPQQQLRPVSISREIHPPLHHQRPGGPPCRSMAKGRTSATGYTSRTTAGRSSSWPGPGRPGRLQHRANDERTNIEGRPAGSSSTWGSRAA